MRRTDGAAAYRVDIDVPELDVAFDRTVSPERIAMTWTELAGTPEMQAATGRQRRALYRWGIPRSVVILLDSEQANRLLGLLGEVAQAVEPQHGQNSGE